MARLAIDCLGELAVRRDGTALPLPASRKARALLGYLALTLRPHRRERLCELLWQLPDDPRAALRWALSKLRAVTDPDDPFIADRERVGLDGTMVEIDLDAIRARLLDDPPFVPPRDLRAMAARLALPLLDGLDAAGGDAFALWLAHEREDTHRLRNNVLRRLALHPDVQADEAISWATL